MPRHQKDWNPKYQRILILHQEGVPQQDIAKELGMNPASICRIIKKEVFQEKHQKCLERAVEQARKVFEQHAVRAARKIVRMAKNGTSRERIQFDASKEVLYQVGLKPVEVIEERKRDYTPEEIASAGKIAAEVKQIVDRLSQNRSRFVIQRPDDVGPEEPSA